MILVGDIDFDVHTVDVDSLQLGRCDGLGTAAIPLAKHIKIRDSGSPSENESSAGACMCSGAPGADGIDDLAMKFSGHELADALQLKGEHGELTLELTGSSWDGNVFVARGCIKIVP